MEELEDQKGRKSINLTDQDARFMKMRHGFLPAYNAQAMVSPAKTGRRCRACWSPPSTSWTKGLTTPA